MQGRTLFLSLNMRQLLLYLSLSFCCICFAQKVQGSFTVTCIQPYCGGARPSPEMEAEAQKPKPYANQTIALVSDKGKKLYLKTNADGVVKCSLKPGRYMLYEKWRFKKTGPNGKALNQFDADCLKAEWKKDFAVLVVNEKDFIYNESSGIHMPCYFAIPCLLERYRPNIPE